MAVVHYVDRWLPLSAGFVHAHVTRSRHRAVVVSRDAREQREAFPHRPVISLGAIRRLGEGRAARVARTAALSAITSTVRARVLHVHFGYAVHDVLGVSRRRRLPLVLSLHGDDATALPLQRPGFYEPVVDAVDALVVPSAWLAERAVALGFDRVRVHALP